MQNVPEEKPEAKNPRHRRLNSHVFIVIVVVALATIGLFSYFSSKHQKSEAGIANRKEGAVPITSTAVHKGDVGTTLEALGTVTPIYTVSVFSRIQGQITQVNYREGQMVKKGDSLVEIDPRPYEAALLEAQGNLARDRALLQEARIDLQRYRKAYKRNAIQKQLLDDQEQIALQDAGTVVSDEGALKNAQVNLEYCHITAPIDGRVGLRLVDPGNMVQANSTTSLVVITQLQPITVIFSVAEDGLSGIQEQLRNPQASEHPMTVEALDRSQEKKLATGKFLTLDNQIDTTTGTVRVRAVFDNKDNALFPNQFVNARLLLSTQYNATVVALPAIQRGSQGTFVYVINPDHTVKMQPIKVGTIDGDIAAVQGLEPGQEVALKGFDKLQDGAKVSIRQETQGSPADHELAGTAGKQP
jgi:multidrug efflux system membrane fusion protein